MNQRAKHLLECELQKHGISFWIDPESGRHAFERGDGLKVFLSLDSIQKELSEVRLAKRIEKLIESATALDSSPTWAVVRDSVFWCLEPTDYKDKPELSSSVSEHCIRCLVIDDQVRGRITWINQTDLARWQVSRDELESRASDNLNSELARATLHLNEAQGIQFLMLGSRLAFKASLLLASALRGKVEPEIGWPIYAIAPSRDFLWMWGEKDHPTFTNLLGSVV